MNELATKFNDAFIHYLDYSDDVKTKIDSDILQYANENKEVFYEQFEEIMFTEDSEVIYVVFSALSKASDDWGSLYVMAINKIIETAEASDKPENYLTHLFELYVIEEQRKPFVQQLAERLQRAMYSSNMKVQWAAISMLPDLLFSGYVRNRSNMIAEIQEFLKHRDWRYRVVAHKAIESLEESLPHDFRLSILDRLRMKVFGEPSWFN